jgi:hypothetical protein
VTRGRRYAARALAGALVVTVLTWSYFIIRRSRAYTVTDEGLRGWTLELADVAGPGVVALRPPPQLWQSLVTQVSQRADEPFVSPDHPAVPLVLQAEYSDSLQGAMSVDDIMDVARDAGIEMARFGPVCVGRRVEPTSHGSGTVFFVVFEAAAFNEFRQQLSPLFPEHAGAALFEPAAFPPVLVLGATDRELLGWAPAAIDRPADCQASVQVD